MLKQSVNQKKVTIGMPEMISRVGARGVSGEFTPADIASSIAWWDMSDASSMFKNDDGSGGNVGQDGDLPRYLFDKTGNGNNATVPTTTNTAQYFTNIQGGLSSLLFDNVDDYYNISALGDVNCFAVVTLTSFELFEPVIALHGGSYDTLLSSLLNTRWEVNHLAYGGTPSINPTIVELNMFKSAGAVNALRQDNINIVTGFRTNGASGSGPLIGRTGTRYFGGYMHEIVACSADISAEDRTSLYAYFERWAI